MRLCPVAHGTRLPWLASMPQSGSSVMRSRTLDREIRLQEGTRSGHYLMNLTDFPEEERNRPW